MRTLDSGAVPWTLAIALASTVACDATAAQPPHPNHYRTERPHVPGARFFGESLALVGDIDGDGYSDYVVGEDRTAHVVYSGHTGTVLHVLSDGRCGDELQAAAAGDVDNDGTPDIMVAKLGHFCAPFEGEVRIHSGRTFALLHTFLGDAAGHYFGGTMAALGDVDGDGFGDVAIGAPMWYATRPRPGYVQVFSGRAGGLIWRADGPLAIDRLFGASLAALGDLDGDGVSDLGIGGQDFIQVRSGRTGVVLHTINRPGGADLAGIGDVDGDGTPDYAAGVAAANGFVGVVEIYSGTGSLLRTIPGRSDMRFFGTVATLGDITGDGRAEIVVGAYGGAGRRGYVQVIDATNGSVKFTVPGDVGENFGWSVDAGADLTGDGMPDLLATAPQQRIGGSGYARVLSSSQLPLQADTTGIDLQTGGSQTWDLRSGFAHRNRPYALVGSRVGIGATPFAGCTVPLVPDSYTELTLLSANTALFTNTIGVLDASGRATASFNLPTGLPPVVRGLRLWHAYLVFTGPGSCVSASNAMPVELR